jgi:DNA-binding NtrC family response regulator
VLVVEDDASLRLLCRVNLELDGLSVREAATVAAARAEIESERPSIVFLDVHLAGQSSEVLMEELVDAGVPVVLMTGSADVSQFRGRVAEVLGKPFEPAALLAAVRRHVG